MIKKLLALICALMLAAAGAALAEEAEAPVSSEEGGEVGGGNESCAVHALIDIAETPATCTQSGMKTRQCSVCGAMVFEMTPATGVHRWMDMNRCHVCTTCGFSEEHSFAENGRGHVCTVCGLMSAHVCFVLDDKHACALCGYIGEHDFSLSPHACSMCSYVTAHEYSDENPHVCTICGERTAHEYTAANPHVCAICGFESSHNFSDDPHECSICGERTEHDYAESDPHECTVCGERTEHDYSGDDPHECAVCGKRTGHDYSGGDPHECAVCGKRTEHVWTEESRENGGLYAPTLVRLRCGVCSETTEEMREPLGNPLDRGTASLSVSAEGGLIALRERQPGELAGAGAGMTLTFELKNEKARFAEDEVVLWGGGGLAGWNVFAGRIDRSEARLRMTVLASVARAGQAEAVESGVAYVKLPIESAEESVTVLCQGEGFETEARVSVAAVRPEEEPSETEPQDDGDASYSLRGDRVVLRKDGRLYEGRLGSAAFEEIEGEERLAVTLNAVPCLLGGRLVFINGKGKTAEPDDISILIK